MRFQAAGEMDMTAEPAIPLAWLFIGGWAAFLFLVAANVCNMRLASRLRQISPGEWMRLGAPAPTLVPRAFPLHAAVRGLMAETRLALWATFTEGHARLADSRLSRCAWIVRINTLLLLAAAVAFLALMPLGRPA